MSIKKVELTYFQVLKPTSYLSPSCPIYKRLPSGKTEFYFSGNGTVYIFDGKDNNYTVTWVRPYSNQNSAFDENLDTCASCDVPTYTAETDAVIIDFQTNEVRFLFFKLSTSSSSVTHRVYLSSDGSTWTKIHESNSAVTVSTKATFRYVKITVGNPTGVVGLMSYIYEVNAFKPANALYQRNITFNDGVAMYETLLPSYWIWVDPNPSLSLSVYEKQPPSDVSEVLIS